MYVSIKESPHFVFSEVSIRKTNTLEVTILRHYMYILTEAGGGSTSGARLFF